MGEIDFGTHVTILYTVILVLLLAYGWWLIRRSNAMEAPKSIEEMQSETRRLEAEASLLRAKRNLRDEQQPWRAYIPVVMGGLSGVVLVLGTAALVLTFKQ